MAAPSRCFTGNANGIFLRRNEIARAHLFAREPELGRDAVEQPLHHEGALRPAGGRASASAGTKLVRPHQDVEDDRRVDRTGRIRLVAALTAKPRRP